MDTKTIKIKFHQIHWDSYYQSKFEHQGEATHVIAEISGEMYPLYFYEPDSLYRETKRLRFGETDFAIPNLFVIAKISLEEIHRVVESAYQQGYFCYLKPITQDRLNSGDTNWYPCLPDGTWV